MRIRIRIKQLKLMRIHADPDTDPDPKPCKNLRVETMMFKNTYDSSCVCLLRRVKLKFSLNVTVRSVAVKVKMTAISTVPEPLYDSRALPYNSVWDLPSVPAIIEKYVKYKTFQAATNFGTLPPCVS